MSAALVAARSLFLPVLLTACLGGCGYRLMGAAAPHALRIGPVADEGIEPLFGADLRAALARESVDRGDIALAGGGEPQSHLLTAHVKAIRDVAVAYVAGDKAREYLLSAEAEATLTAPGGKVVWKGLKITADRQYSAGETVEDTQTNKKAALPFLADDLALEILRRASLFLEAGAKGR